MVQPHLQQSIHVADNPLRKAKLAGAGLFVLFRASLERRWQDTGETGTTPAG